MPIRTDPTARPEAAAAFPGPVASPVRPERSGALAPRPAVSPGRPATRPAPRKADPTPARLAVAAGGIATVSALLAAIGGAAVPAATVASAPASGGTGQSTVRYIYVPSGQTAPSVGVATSIASPAPAQVQATRGDAPVRREAVTPGARP